MDFGEFLLIVGVVLLFWWSSGCCKCGFCDLIGFLLILVTLGGFWFVLVLLFGLF